MSEIDVMVFEQAVRSGKARTVAAVEAAVARQAQADAEAAARVRAAWEPFLEVMRAALPGWAHGWLEAPVDREPTFVGSDYDLMFVPATLRAPAGLAEGVTPIRVWASSPHVEKATVVFAAARWAVMETENDGWVAAARWEFWKRVDWEFRGGQAVLPAGNFAGFEVALAEAVDAGARLGEVQAEAAMRNAARVPVDEAADVVAPKVTATDWLALAAGTWQEALAALERAGASDSELGALSWRRVGERRREEAQVLALLGIGTELRELGEAVAAATAAPRWGG